MHEHLSRILVLLDPIRIRWINLLLVYYISANILDQLDNFEPILIDQSQYLKATVFSEYVHNSNTQF